MTASMPAISTSFLGDDDGDTSDVTGAGFVSWGSLLRAGLTGERPSAWKTRGKTVGKGGAPVL